MMPVFEMIPDLRSELDASRAREAKLVEALRNIGIVVTSLAASKQIIREMVEEALAEHTPAEMPSDVHPQEG